MDRIFVQVIYGKQIKNIHGVDINDPTYRKKWIESNLDLFLYELAGSLKLRRFIMSKMKITFLVSTVLVSLMTVGGASRYLY